MGTPASAIGPSPPRSRKSFKVAEWEKPGAAPRRRLFEPLLQVSLDGPLVAHLGPLRVGAGLAERPALA
jgi:hypothetical protein